MAVKQISVFLENKPGTLEEMTQVLADAGIGMNALSLAETKDFGIVRMIVDNVYATATLLREHEYICRLTDVVMVKIPDVVGGLNRLLVALKKAGINLEYMYASLGGKNDAYMIMRVENVAKAEKALSAAGFGLVDQESADAM